MKNFFILSAVALATIASLAACRTNEENYRKAYERAKANEKAGIEETIYNKIREEAKPTEVEIDGEKIGMRVETVTVTKDQDVNTTDLKRYNLVVAQFRQLFHARSMASRLADAGYPGAFIVETREPLYYVVLKTSADPSEINALAKTFAATTPIPLQEDMPWILCAPNR